MSSPTPAAPGLWNWLLILALGVIWGTAFMGVTLALEGLGPWWVTAGRVGVAAAVVAAVGGALGQGLGRIGGARAWGYVAVIGVLATALPFALLSWGLTQVPSAFAGVAMGTVPLLVLPLAAVFSPDEGIGPRRIIGVACGFVGLVVLIGPGAFGDGSWPGRLACIVAACCYAVGSILTRRAPPVPPVAFAAGALGVAAVILVPTAWALEGTPRLTHPPALWALFYVALFPTGLAAIIRVRVITTAGSIFMSLTSYMVPIWAVIFGVTILGETPSPRLYWALALILCGIAISQSRRLSQLFRP